jgi:hypothetical protein
VPSKRKCLFSKPDGTTCQATALSTSTFCFFHAPEKAEARAEAQKKGGRQNRRPAEIPDVPLDSVTDVVKALATTFNDVRSGRLDPKTGNCLALLSGQLLKALQTSELEERLEALEKMVAQQKRFRS